MSRQKIKNKWVVYVAMSGGVDSSVAAALLKEQGFNVVGVFMKPWSPSAPISNSKFLISNNPSCIWKEDREDAMRAASVLGIPFKTWDFSKQYKKSVTDYMIREYKAGRTPNPDVMCNKEIKFGLFFDKAIKEGTDYIATGHYVRLVKQSVPRLPLNRPASDLAAFVGRSPAQKAGTMPASLLKARFGTNCFTYHLRKAKDKNKDQSYFLWALKQKQLAKCLFPIGDYIKPEVRKMAKKFGLPNYDKKDSQGVCFIGPLDMKSFLKTKIKPKQGDIRLLMSDLKGVSKSDFENSSVIGQHDGVYYYTIGQRHGLNIGTGGGPYYVVSKNVKKNIIYVGDEKNLYSKKLKVLSINWINDNITPHFFSNKGHLPVDVKVRYRSKSKRAILSKNGTLKFLKPIRAITSGQSAVFYKKGELLGGGIIK